jgi:hypothetical protein
MGAEPGRARGLRQEALGNNIVVGGRRNEGKYIFAKINIFVHDYLSRFGEACFWWVIYLKSTA